MKTIIRKNNNVSLYLFSDDEVVDVQKDKTLVGNPLKFTIADCNSDNCVLIENVTEPEDWYGHKYRYSNGWIANVDWNPNPSIYPPGFTFPSNP